MADNWNDIACLSSGRDADFGFSLSSLNPVKIVKSVGKTVKKATNTIGNKLSDVPVVGKGLHAVYDLGPAGLINLGANIATGARIDKAVLHHFKNQIHDVRDVAPYVQTIVSFVPAVGPGVSGAIGAASALSRGKPISEAIISGVKESLPGGPLARAALDVAIAGVQGKPIDQLALNAIPLPEDQKQYVIQAVMAAKDIAKGKRVDHALYDRGKNLLPPDAQKALQIGVALGHAKNLQDVMKTAAKEVAPKLLEVAKIKVGTDQIINAGVKTLKGEVQKGFLKGSGLVSYKFSPIELHAVRDSLAPEEKKGFDIAVSTHIGRLTKPLRNAKLDPQVKLGYYATHGMSHAKASRKDAMRAVLVSHPKTLHGVLGARRTAEKEADIHNLSFWERLKHFITGR